MLLFLLCCPPLRRPAHRSSCGASCAMAATSPSSSPRCFNLRSCVLTLCPTVPHPHPVSHCGPTPSFHLHHGPTSSFHSYRPSPPFWVQPPLIAVHRRRRAQVPRLVLCLQHLCHCHRGSSSPPPPRCPTAARAYILLGIPDASTASRADIQKGDDYRVMGGRPLHTRCERCSRCATPLLSGPHFVDPEDAEKVSQLFAFHIIEYHVIERCTCLTTERVRAVCQVKEHRAHVPGQALSVFSAPFWTVQGQCRINLSRVVLVPPSSAISPPILHRGHP
jgi:hypothetical protein